MRGVHETGEERREEEREHGAELEEEWRRHGSLLRVDIAFAQQHCCGLLARLTSWRWRAAQLQLNCVSLDD